MTATVNFNIVLVEPEIPPNTGNISRLCAATGSRLHLIKPLGFSLDDRHLKRAGLDYWHLVEVLVYENWDDFLAKARPEQLYLATTRGGRSYDSVAFAAGSYLAFGKETKGLPQELLDAYPGRCLRIPMLSEARSLNLSNAVAVVLYEALRQHGFPGLK